MRGWRYAPTGGVGLVVVILGKIFKNRKLEAEGKAENLDGSVQEKIGKFKKVVGK